MRWSLLEGSAQYLQLAQIKTWFIFLCKSVKNSRQTVLCIRINVVIIHLMKHVKITLESLSWSFSLFGFRLEGKANPALNFHLKSVTRLPVLILHHLLGAMIILTSVEGLAAIRRASQPLPTLDSCLRPCRIVMRKRERFLVLG